MFWEWLSFWILSSDLWGSSSQLKASNMDLMVIACRSALDETSKPQCIIHMCIVNHFPNVYYICSVKESHVCLISVLFFFGLIHSTPSETHSTQWLWTSLLPETKCLNTDVVNYAFLMSSSLCRHLVQPLFGAIVLLLFIPQAYMRVHIHKHTSAHLCLKKSKCIHSFL